MGRLSLRDRKLAYAAGENPSHLESDAFALSGVSANQTVLAAAPPVLSVPLTSYGILSQRIYWNYIGYTQKTLVVDYVQFIQQNLAVGAQVAEVALATTASAPDGTAKTFTCVAVADTLPDLTTGTVTNGLVRQNVTAGGWIVSPATHLWAAARFQMATTQPGVCGVGTDLQTGTLQSTASVVVPMVIGTSYAGALFAATTGSTQVSPLLRLVVRP